MLKFKEFRSVEILKNEDGININPRYWDYSGVYLHNIAEEINKLLVEASVLTEIVFPVFVDETGKEFVPVTLGKCQNPMVLFNAEQTDVVGSQYFVYTYNTGRGALCKYWTEVRIKFKSGKLWSK